MTGHERSVTRNPMKSPARGIVWIAVVWTCGLVCPSAAIEVQPSQAQIQLALGRGKEAAAHRQAPETFYTRFGSGDDLHPGGFLSRNSADCRCWPKFLAKIVATFRYADFDPNAQTTITVFPATGGESHFSLNFAEIE